MSTKLLINSISGGGKTDLLRTLRPNESLVISRDAKAFSLPLPHLLVETWEGMTVFIQGIVDTMEKFKDKTGEYPTTVAIDSVSQVFMDVIDKASQTPNVFGSQGAEITAEMALLTQFIHESLEMSGINVVLLSHVIPERDEGKDTGSYTQFGSGKFLAKGAFFSTTNESITIVVEGSHRTILLRGTDKLARTQLPELPDKMYVANTVHPDKSKKLKEGETYFELQAHLDRLVSAQQSTAEWSL